MEPVSALSFLITSTIASAVGPFTTLSASTIFLISDLASVAIIGGGLAAASALAGGGRQGTIRQSQQASETVSVGNSARYVCLGRGRLAGEIIFPNASGQDLYRAIAHCQGPIDAVEEVYINGRIVTVDADGTVSSPPYAFSGGSYAKVFHKLGTNSDTAFTQLTSAFPTLWTTDHKGLEVAKTLSIFTSPNSSATYNNIFTNGKPVTEVLVRGMKVFDPRDNTQSFADPSTWKWSDNSILCILWYLTANPEFGWGFDIDRFDLDDIAAEADKADALVALKAGGTEKFSTCNGVYSTDEPRGSTLASLLISTGVMLIPILDDAGDQKIGIRLIDDQPATTTTIAESNILGIEWKGGPDNIDRPNRAKVSYYSPERRYKTGEVGLDDVSWAEYPTEIALYGEQVREFDLQFCASHRQASRIARRLFAVARAPTGSVTTNLAGLVSFGHKYASIAFPEFDGTILAQIASPALEDGGDSIGDRLTFPFTEFPALSVWVPATDEGDPPPTLPEFTESNLAAPEIASVKWVKTGTTTNDIRIKYNPVSGATSYEATYRTWDGSVAGTRTGMDESSTDLWAKTDSNIPEGARYLVSVRAADANEVSKFAEVDFTTEYDETAPTGITFNATENWDGGGLTAFTATLTFEVQDINVAQYKIEFRLGDRFGPGPWEPIVPTTWMKPYTKIVRTQGFRGPSTGQTYIYDFRLTVYNSTGQGTTAISSFTLVGPYS